MKPCCKIARRDAIIHAQMLVEGVAAVEPQQNYRALVVAIADMLAPLKEPPKPMAKREVAGKAKRGSR